MPSPFSYKPVGNGGATSTGSITLSAASGGSQTVTPATRDVYVTLPDATGLSKSSNVFVINNAGDFDLGIKNSVGTKLGWLRPKTVGAVALSSNTTSAGVWSINNLLKTGVTMQYQVATAPAGTGNFYMFNAIALDADRTCLLFGWDNIYAVIYNSATQQLGSATLVRSTITSAGGIVKLGIKSATDRVLIVSAETTNMEAVVLSISGTAITVNAAVALLLAADISIMGYLIAVGSSFVQGYTNSSPANSYVVAITISGTAPTFGTPAVIQAINNVSYLYASGSVLRTIIYNAALYATPYTVSGSTLTLGTSTSTAATNVTYRVFMNGGLNIVAHYLNTNQSVAVFKLTGTTEAVSAVALIATAQSPSNSDYNVISTTKTVFMTSSGSTWYSNILTDTGGTATVGTTITGTGAGTFSSLVATRVSGNTAQFVAQVSSLLYQFTLDCSGISSVLSSVVFSGNTTTITPSPSQSNLDGSKGNSALKAGGLYHKIGDVGFDLLVSSGSILRSTKLGNFTTPNFTVSDDNIGYCYYAVNQAAVGGIIQRVEAAA